MILLPLLGLHYVVMPFRPEAGAPGEIAYQIVSAVFTSFQVCLMGWLLNMPFPAYRLEIGQVERNRFTRRSLRRHKSFNDGLVLSSTVVCVKGGSRRPTYFHADRVRR